MGWTISNLNINPQKEKTFTLKIRIPGWAKNKAVPGDLYFYLNETDSDADLKDETQFIHLTVNGEEEKLLIKNGYAEITREWNKGDKVELVLPMAIHQVAANANVSNDKNKIAFEYGPIVYCAEEIDDKNISNISISDSIELKPEVETLLSNKIISIKGESNGSKFKLIPYYLWSNRGVGKMKVWFPKTN